MSKGPLLVPKCSLFGVPHPPQKKKILDDINRPNVFVLMVELFGFNTFSVSNGTKPKTKRNNKCDSEPHG